MTKFKSQMSFSKELATQDEYPFPASRMVLPKICCSLCGRTASRCPRISAMSPVLNARGELVGLAFDGNWESMSSDVMFEPDLQRCICVDIRYVLFLVEKLGGASHIIDELDFAK